MTSSFTKALLGSALVSLASANLNFAQNTPPKSSNVKILGKTKDPNFNVNIYRDGGSSVYANGYHMMIYADTIVAEGAPSPQSMLTAHNSLAYFGYDDPTDPTIMHDFGSQTPHTRSNVLAAPMGTVPFSNETDQYGIWPSSNMAVLSDGVTTVGMFPMVEFASSSAVYNTMVTVNVTDPKTLGNSGPPTNRIVNQFFYANEPLYGGLSILKGDLDGLLYMFASVSNGVKLARVREDQMTDRSKFEYWDGKKFQSKMPQKNDPAANVLQFSVGTLAGNVGPDVGDVFWSDFHQTFLMVFMDSSISGQFWVSYSTDGGLTNWSKAEKLWQPLPNPTWKDECDASGMGGKWNYAGHAHPHWDPSGKTLLLSWSSCTVWVNMATLTWEGSTPEPLKPAAPVAAANTPSHAAAASTHIAAVPTTAPAATSVAPVVVAAASSSTAHTAATPDAKPQPLGLGSDGRIQFPAAQEAYKLRKRAAAAAVQSPPLRQDEIERRAVQTQRVQDRNRHFANHARIHRRRAERGATAAHGSVS